MASEATAASKQPQKSDLTSDLKFVAQIIYNAFVMPVWASVHSLLKKIKREEEFGSARPVGFAAGNN